VAGSPDLVRNELKIAPELTIICALAVGYPDPDFPTNNCASAATRSRSTSCSSTVSIGSEGGQRGYRTTSCNASHGRELEEDRVNA
jgi:hypothetical protein